jgi:DNA-binding helix-hairpin-helix protein with protein kinase domain
MNQLLRASQTVWMKTSRQSCVVETYIGGGGQGEVYTAHVDEQTVAVKWYFREVATPDQERALEALVRRSPPTSRFLWPMDLAYSDESAGFGYVMPLREPRFRSMFDLVTRRIDPTMRVIATVAYNLVDSFHALHATGLCYRDISLGNVFLDPGDGDVLICDNDNVGVRGESHTGVAGTPKFMAPEIVRGEREPSEKTDLFSLAVLLFYIFIGHHPLNGRRELAIRCLDRPAMIKLYGIEPVFIFDPNDDSNRPELPFHGNAIESWPVYPEFLRDLFITSFTTGIADPAHGRVRENVWRSALIRLRDAIYHCAQCDAENFFDASAVAPACWSCGAELQRPPCLRIERQLVVLDRDAKLYNHHADPTRQNDFGEVVAELAQHPSNPAVWGLRNLSEHTWVRTMAAGEVDNVLPGQATPLHPGTRLRIGRVEAEIV